MRTGIKITPHMHMGIDRDPRMRTRISAMQSLYAYGDLQDPRMHTWIDLDPPHMHTDFPFEAGLSATQPQP